MVHEFAIRTICDDEWREYRAIRLRALEDSPDAFGSTLERELGFPDSAWKSRLRQASPETDLPVIAVVGGAFAGLAWGRIEPPGADVVHLYQMWVEPESRGAGIGRALVATVIEWARARDANSILLDVTCGDRPARRLYESMGFQPCGDPIPLRDGTDLLEQPMELGLKGRAT